MALWLISSELDLRAELEETAGQNAVRTQVRGGRAVARVHPGGRIGVEQVVHVEPRPEPDLRPDGSVLVQTALSMSRLSHEALPREAAEIARLVRLTLGGDWTAFEQIILRYETRMMTLAAQTDFKRGDRKARRALLEGSPRPQRPPRLRSSLRAPQARRASERFQERDEVGPFLVGEDEPHVRFVVSNDVLERRGNPVMKVGRTCGERAPRRRLEPAEIAPQSGNVASSHAPCQSSRPRRTRGPAPSTATRRSRRCWRRVGGGRLLPLLRACHIARGLQHEARPLIAPDRVAASQFTVALLMAKLIVGMVRRQCTSRVTLANP